MARPYGSLDDDLEDVGSLYRVKPTSRRAHQSLIPLEAGRVLEKASATNRYPSTSEIDTIAYRSGLAANTVRTWFHSRFGDAEPHQPSAHSDPFTAAPLNPTSVQSDVRCASSWFDQAEAVIGASSYGAQSVLSSIHQYLDLSTSNYSASSFARDSATDPPLHISPEGGPWHPGSRQDQASGHGSNPAITLSADGQPPQALVEYDQSAYNPYEHSPSPSVADSTRPCTVSSEAIGSTRSRARYARRQSQGNITRCDHCGAQFTGRYGQGNCSRHVRQQHSQKSAQLASACVCRACQKPFARQDARRKHEWKKHRLPGTKPRSRREAVTHEDSTSYAGTHDAHSDQGTPTGTHTLPEEPIVCARYRLPASPQRAHDHFASVQAELGHQSYNTYCQAVLAYCGYIVEQLQKKQSDVHHVFVRLLQDLSSQLLPEQLASPESPGPSERCVDADDDTTHRKSSGARQSRGKAPASRRASTTSLRFEPYARNNKKADDNPLIALLRLFKLPAYLGLDCPVHKFYITHGMASPCNGCAEDHPNGVRQHLLPTYSQQHVDIHPGHVPFMKRCGHCTEDIIDEVIWESRGHKARTCQGAKQPRGISVIVWARLFLKIFPGETSIPSPYRNDPRFLPNEVVAAVRQEVWPSALVSTVSSGTQPMHQPPDDRQDETDPDHNAAPLRWLNARLEQTVSLETLISCTSHLLEQLRAELNIRQTLNIGVIEDIEDQYRARLQNLQQHQDLSFNAVDMTSSTPTPFQEMQQIQAPITGGADDFQTPPLQPEAYGDRVRLHGSDVGTQPSTQEYYHGGTSFGMPSFFSSQTDYDNGSFMFPDQGQAALSPLQAGPSNCSPATYFPENQWPQYDERLDVPGSSRMHQAIAEEYAEEYSSRQLAAEIDQSMEMSPSASHAPMECDENPSPSNVNWESTSSGNNWYNY
ncbi:hypothetical protein CC86DRAFT_412313 [Ophiobolus disseminans]|uniref:Homeobox domain-containing protein n=1 Tax=Ophiobolus disseminans TaxID=1469910 RepID=A0A6A6ZJM6_9PLEO|nr:hypothetical protein CC86DRAFT_412313 [Ophiobolus disseminans]